MNELKEKVDMELLTFIDEMVSVSDCSAQIIALCMDAAIDSATDLGPDADKWDVINAIENLKAGKC